MASGSDNPAAEATPAQDKPSRRQVLMRTAESLFARKGIDAVSLNEINKAAGQRNTSAMHYHFGSKDGLVQSIIYEHYAEIDRHINRLLDEYETTPADERTPRDMLRALVIPFADQLDSTEGVNYLLIVRQVLMKSSEMLLSGHPQGQDSARLRIFRLFNGLLPGQPAAVREARVVLGAGLIFNALAGYAGSLREGDAPPPLSKPSFVSNLLDSLEAVLTTPPSPQTLSLLAGATEPPR